LAATLAGLLVGTRQPYAAMGLVGVGNALFHVGAGGIVLRQWLGHAAGPGIFVAPGALGLAVGVQQGLARFPYRWAIASGMAAAAIVLALIRTDWPACPASQRDAPIRPTLFLAAAVVLLFVSVAIRALIGNVLIEPWRDIPRIAWLLTAAAVAGKALGGIAADSLGWRLVPVAALVLMPLIAAWAVGNVPLSTLNMLLLQTTMAVTLSATAVALPGRPSLAFGLPSLALLAGHLVGASGMLPAYAPEAAVGPLSLVAALTIFIGLGCLGFGAAHEVPGNSQGGNKPG
jgi:FSR family fosmidomycin resistance protein-like MFS transporter